jgi:sulfate permease
MTAPMFSVLLIPFVIAMFLAVNMGGSGTSPSFSAAYGANIIRKEFIPGLFGVFVFAGAILAGKKVSLTISRGILPDAVMGLTLTSIVLLSVALALLIANLLRVPQSTSQATVFALVGPAVYFDVLQTRKLVLEIIPTWLILPVLAFALTFLIGRIVSRARRTGNGLGLERVARSPALRYLVIGASCYVAFAIGSNNVANAAGPLASMVSKELGTATEGSGFTLILILATLIIAPCFGIGSSLLGYRVVETTGKEIVDFGPVGATLVAAVTATLLLCASVTRGIPTSLVQMNTASIVGLGIAKIGWRPILTRTPVRKLLIIWIVAPAISLALSFSLTAAAHGLGIL